MIKDNFFGKMNLEESYFDLQKLRRDIKGKRKKKVTESHFIGEEEEESYRDPLYFS